MTLDQAGKHFFLPARGAEPKYNVTCHVQGWRLAPVLPNPRQHVAHSGDPAFYPLSPHSISTVILLILLILFG